MIDRRDISESTRMAGRVRRYHAWPTITEQTVGEHSWRVATLYVELFGLPRAEVLLYCLHHDSGELTAGDIPFGAKKLSAQFATGYKIAEEHGLDLLGVELPKLDMDEAHRVKLCDLLEMLEFGTMEYRMGNQYALPIVKATWHEIAKLAETVGAGRVVMQWMIDNRMEVAG